MKKNLPIVTLLFILSINVSAQTIWKKIDKTNSSEARNLIKEHYVMMKLDFDSFLNKIKKAHLRDSNNTSLKPIQIDIPDNKGELTAYNIYEAPVFSKTLSNKYPDIKSYIGINAKNSAEIIRISLGPKGIQTTLLRPNSAMVFMHPIKGKKNTYIVYDRNYKDSKDTDTFKCLTEHKEEELNVFNRSFSKDGVNDQTLRKFRIAISVNGEYTKYHGGTVKGALEAINATLTRVNAVYESELAISFELVDSEKIIFTDPEKDPYAAVFGNQVPASWNYELQNTLSQELGNEKYDIGHMFGASGGGGNAGCIGCVCVDDNVEDKGDQNKGAGITSPANGKPEGDAFDIDFVCHEIGHQMGANHTFSIRNENKGVNFEPGSGSTIMGYAGITRENDVQANTSPYFHYASIKQIIENTKSIRKCWSSNKPVTLSNNPPLVDAGKTHHIPKGTAYKLTGSATDSDKDSNLKYCWEQIDNGLTKTDNFGPYLKGGSMTRSLPPTDSPTRSIPKLSTVITGNLTETKPNKQSNWETVSLVARELKWALTVRDVRVTDKGVTEAQTVYDTTTIIVEDIEPFTVNELPIVKQKNEFKVSWNVGKTAGGTINCKKVNIKLSADGGRTFTHKLAVDTDNDGEEIVTMPNVDDTENAYIMVEAADNVFYAVSKKFKINDNPDYTIIASKKELSVCNTEEVSYFIDFTTSNGFDEKVSFTAIEKPEGLDISFYPQEISESGKVKVVFSNLNSSKSGVHDIKIQAKSASITKELITVLKLSRAGCVSYGSEIFDSGTTLVKLNEINNETDSESSYNDYTLEQKALVNKGESYDLSIKVNTDGDFKVKTRVWIDWNQNCSFDDEGESYDLGETTDKENGLTSKSPLSIEIPKNALLGRVSMRVSTKYMETDKTVLDPCEEGFEGEVEDYTLLVSDYTASLEKDVIKFEKEDGIGVYPNPTKGKISIKLPRINTNQVTVKIYSLLGHLVKKQSFTTQETSFDKDVNLHNLKSGVYIVYIEGGSKPLIQKIILNK